MFALARELKMTVRELGQRMDSTEFSEWIAYSRYFSAMPDPWLQTAIGVTAALAPHAARGKQPKVETFNPVEKPPQHHSQDVAALLELRRALGMGEMNDG